MRYFREELPSYTLCLNFDPAVRDSQRSLYSLNETLLIGLFYFMKNRKYFDKVSFIHFVKTYYFLNSKTVFKVV